MKAVILAGGLGTRLSEETQAKPKPMVEVGGKPILWHIMKIYSSHGINDFIVCCGYRGYTIKEYFANYFLHTADVTFDLGNHTTVIHEKKAESWRVTLIDTGESTATGGRLKRVRKYLHPTESFCFTYGDGVTDVNIAEVISSHEKSGRLATVTAVRPPGRYGSLILDDEKVVGFSEKAPGEGGWINAGYFVLCPDAIDYIDTDQTSWEREPLMKLARESQLNAFFHTGYWQPMDTLRERNLLEQQWATSRAPWKSW